MAVVTPVPAIGEGMGTMSFHRMGSPGMSRPMVEASVARVIQEKMYVAVGKDVSKSKSTLLWAMQNSGGRRICILHVHQPAQMIPVMGAKFPVSALKEEEVMFYREMERDKMHKVLEDYVLICRRMGVRAEKLYIEMDSIEKGILELISLYGIRKLVMGAASDRQYSRRMMDLKSKKAAAVRREAPASCHIWFTCKGYLIHTREALLDEPDTENASSSLPESSSPENLDRSVSQSEQPQHDIQANINDIAWSRCSSAQSGTVSYTTASETEGLLSPRSRSVAEGSCDEWDRLSRTSPSQVSGLLPQSSTGVVDASLTPSRRAGETVNSVALGRLNMLEEDIHSSSPPSVLDGSIDDAVYEQLQQAMTEAQNSRREAYEEAFRRQKAEKDAFEAMRRAKASETLYSEELKRRKEVESVLAKENEKLEKMKMQQTEVMEELRIAMDQKSVLESQIAESDRMIKELERKIISAVDLLQSYKQERDGLQIERDRALREAEELRKSQSEAWGTPLPQFFTDFSFSEIEEATRNFDPALKIGEGGYGSIYKAVLRHTQVAIKLLHSNSLQGPAEFQQEVDVLSKMRHPNIITLIGACPEGWTLIYEYLPNGSLEDRLSCKDNSPPLSWQTRVRIAAELCAALIFLHSSKPESIVHGDLKPANILLDANFVSKLSDFGLCRLLGHKENTENCVSVFCKTDPKGTFAYMDPELLATGELTTKSDVYSFGVILLRLLTGRSALGITKEVKYALDNGTLKNVLDPLAGDWPFVQAQQLARLALRCCEITRDNRPDLATEVQRILEPMRASSGGSSSFRLGPKEHCQPPSYFICPIFQEVMQDPHVAADGFTYEAEALRAWLDSGHDTSPMTNLKLSHTSLVPNHALRSAIQEWLQQH